MNGRDFLDSAVRLVVGNSEADWRSASRAYYAAFHVARELLSDLGFVVPRTERAHTYLAYRLSNSGSQQVAKAGSELNSLRGDRNQADYDLRRSLTQAVAQLQVRLAEQVILALDAGRQLPTRTQITDAMKSYERDVLQDVTWQP